MRVLWLCNIMLPAIAEELGLPYSNREGWLTGIYERVCGKEEEGAPELGICFPVPEISPLITQRCHGNPGFRLTSTGIACYAFRENLAAPERYDGGMEAAEYEAQDKKRKEAIDTRNEADSFVFQTEKALNEVGDKIDASAKGTVEDDLAALKAVLERTKDQEMSDSDIDEMKAAKEKLMSDAQALFAKVYEQSQGAAGAGPDMGAQAGPDMNAGPADDVVDGDYREV